jgi:transposase
MLSLPPSVRIFVATQPVDGRKGVDSLIGIVRSALVQDPLSGHLYVFFSRRCDRVRVVYWDRNGFAMWTNQQSSHYTSFGSRRGPWSRLRDAPLAAARSLRRSQRLQCFVGRVAGSS